MSEIRAAPGAGRGEATETEMTGRDDQNPAGSVWGYALAFPLLGTLTAATLDAALGLRLLPAGLEGAREHLVFFGHTLARATLLGTALSLGLVAVFAIAAPIAHLRKWAVHPAVWILAGLLTWWITPLALGLTEGAKISSHSQIGLIRKAVPVVVGIGLLVSLQIAALVLRRLHARGRGFFCRLLGLVCLGGVLAADWVNLTRFPGLYLQAHTILAAICILLAGAGVALLLMGTRLDPTRSPRVAGLVILLALGLVGGGIAARRNAAFPLVQAAEARLAQVTNEARRLTSPLLDAIAPLERARGGQKIVLTEVDAAAIQTALNERLPDRRGLNVLWIAIDTLRADHTGFTPLGAPGTPPRFYDKNDTTPRLNALAKEGFVFRRAQAPYPTSNYSYSSLLTGLQPCATPMYSTKFKRKWQFGDEVFAPNLMKREGRFTLGVTGFNDRASKNPLYFGHMRIGFDTYDPEPSETGRKDEEVTNLFLKTLDSGAKSRPWFGLVHFMGPHDPYPDAGNPFSFGDAPKDRYDADIRQSDREVGRLIDALRERGMLDRTAIFVLSDHGEAFGEHGPNFHNSSLYQNQIHVPLLVRIPGLSGRIVDQPASLVDVLPTTLSLLGIEDSQVRHGQDLFPLMIGENEPERFSFAERYVFRTGESTLHTRAITFGAHKLIEIASPTPVYELYDLFADPGERRNLFGRPEAAEAQTRMLSLLEQELPRFVDHHARLSGHEVESPAVAWQRDHERLMKEVLEGDEGKAAKSLSRYTQKVLLNSFDELSVEARSHLGEEGLAQFRDALVKRYADDLRGGLKAAILRTLSALRDPKLIPFFEGEVTRKNVRLAHTAAKALSAFGNDKGRQLLEMAAASKHEDPCEAAVALGLIGETRVLPLLEAQLGFRQYPVLVNSLRALRALRRNNEVPGLMVRLVNRVFEGSWRAPRLKREVMNLLEDRLKDPRAQEILLEYARSQDPALRRRAETLLEKVMDDASFDRNLAAYDALLAASKLARRGQPAEALPFLEQAAAKATIPYLGLRLMRGQILRAVKEPVAARAVFEEIVTKPSSPAEEALAQSLLAQLDQGAPLFLDKASLKLFVRDATILTERRAHRAVLAVQVENGGKQTLSGGFVPYSLRFDVWFTDAAGKPLKDRRPHLGTLPVGGLAPGASLRVLLPINMPRGEWKEMVIEARLPRWGHDESVELLRVSR